MMRKFPLLLSLLILSFSFKTQAAFNLSGNNIIQSGTDTTTSFITAMQSMSGVTVTTHGNTAHSTFYVVDFGNRSLWIDGNFDLDFNRMQFIFSGTDATDRLYARNGSNFFMRSPQTENGFDFNPEQGQVLFAIENDTVNWNSRTLRVDATATAEFIGVTFKGEFSTWFYGTTLFENCIVEKVGNTGDIQFNVQGNTTLRDVKMYASGQTGVTYRADSRNVITDNVQVFGARDSFNNESSFDVLVEKLDSDTGAIADISQFSAKRHLVKNAKNGTVLVWANHLNGGSPTNYNSGRIEILQTLKPLGFDSLGNGQPGFKFFMQDNPVNGNVSTTMVSDGLGGNLQRTYVFTADGSGVITPFDVLIGAGQSNVDGQGLNGTIKTRGVNTTSGTQNYDDVFNWSAIEYGKNIVSSSAILKGIDGTIINIIFSDDSNITQSNKALVDAYSSINNLEELYDRSKAFLVDNYAGEAETIIAGGGSTLDARNYNIVFDNAAASVFSFDGSTITVRGGVMDCGASRFKNLATTGTVSFINGADPNTCIFTDSVGTNGLLTLTGLLNANVLVYDDADASDATISYQANQSGDLIIPFSGTSSTDYQVVVRRAGYSEVNFEFDPSSGGFYEFPISQFRALTIEGTPIYAASEDLSKVTIDYSGQRINMGDFTVGAQEFYDTVQAYEITEAAMKFPRIANYDGDDKILLLNGYQLRNRDGGGTVPGLNGFVFAETGSILDASNGSVQFLSNSTATVDKQEQIIKMIEKIQGSNWNNTTEDYVIPVANLVDITGPGFDPANHSLSKQIDHMLSRGILDTNTIKDLLD